MLLLLVLLLLVLLLVAVDGKFIRRWIETTLLDEDGRLRPTWIRHNPISKRNDRINLTDASINSIQLG